MKEQNPSIPSPENRDEKPNQEELKERRRNLGLSVLLIFTFVYTGMVLIVLLGGLFYPELVRDTLQQYYKQVYISATVSFLINLSAVFIMGLSFYGLILLWNFKKKGFYFFAFPQLAVIFTLVIVLKSYDWINIALMVIILIIFWASSRNMD